MRTTRTPNELAEAARKAGAEIRTYGIGEGDWRAANYTLTPGGAVLDLETPAGAAKVVSHLAGEVNILNLLAALAAAHARGVPFAHLIEFDSATQARSRPLSIGRCGPALHCDCGLRAHR